MSVTNRNILSHFFNPPHIIDCDSSHWGEDCAFECNCLAGHVSSCDPVTGCTVCEDGWRNEDGAQNCETNINECEEGTAGCDANADCVDGPGFFTCRCRDGYEMNEDTGACDGTNKFSSNRKYGTF